MAHAREAPDDDARWLLVADALAAEKNPLGEYIALTIRGGDPAGKRTAAIARAWRRKYAPWARIVVWWRIGLVLAMRDLDSVFAHIEDLRAIGLPLIVELPRGSNAPDVCTFDDAFTRVAWTRSEQTVTNASWGPGLDEEKHDWRDVVVWRVADRAEIFARRGVAADWMAVELRGDALYAMGGDHELLWNANTEELARAFEEHLAGPGRKFQVWATR